jgi:hypothetical protein
MCTRCAVSCTASRSIQWPYAPICSSGPGGSAKKIMRGVSRNGQATPFASATGFAIRTSIFCGGVKPISRDTSVRIDSSRDAARIDHASYSAG